MRLCNSWIPEEYLVCYQTSQHIWLIIKMLYRYLRRCLLGWHRPRLGFVTPRIGEVYLALSVMHIMTSLASNVTNELVAGWCIMERVKRLASNEICRNQYEHLASVVGYWPEMCLGHVYIVLQPVGSACLTFDDDLYYELCDLMYRSLFGVLDEITDMTRSLEMVET